MLVLLLFVCFVCLEGSFKVIWEPVYVTQRPASLVSHYPHGNREFHLLTLKGTVAHTYTCLGCEGVLIKWRHAHYTHHARPSSERADVEDQTAFETSQ